MNPRRRDRLQKLPPWLEAVIAGGLRDLVARAWFNAPPEERRLRLRTVTALILELDRIRRVDIFATGLGEGVVVEIIEGDWRGARGGLKLFSFEHEAEDLRERYAPLWETFRQVLEGAANEHDALERGEGAN